MTKGNNTIPSNWDWVKIEDISEKSQYGFTTKAVDQGDIFLLRTTDITNGPVNWDEVPYCRDNPEDIDKYRLKEGDILISRAGSVGESYLVNNLPFDNVVFASYLIRFKPKINSKFFKYFLNSPAYWNAITEEKSGIAVPNVNATKLNAIKFPLPPPKVQNSIVEKIDELFSDLDNGIANLKKAKQQLETYKQSVLKAAFEGKITKHWRKQQEDLPTPEELKKQIEEERKRYREQQLEAWRQEVKEWEDAGKPGKKPRKPRKFKDLDNISDEKSDGLAKLPKEWIYVKLGNVCLKITDGTHKSPNNNQSGDYMYITAKNIKEYRIDLEDITYVSEEDHRKIYSRCDVKKNDVLYIKDGATTGKAAVNNLEEEFSLLSSVAVFRTPKDMISPKYLTYFLNSEATRNRMLLNISGNAITRLTLTKLNNAILALCSPQEQDKIVQELETLMSIAVKLESTIEQELEKAEALRQSILKKAFEGKLITEY